MKRAPGSYAGLTATQAKLLSYLRFEQAEGRSPSFVEMKEAMQLSTKSGVSRLVVGLVERGYIERLEHRARSIRVLDATTPAPPLPVFDIREIPLAALLAELRRRMPDARPLI